MYFYEILLKVMNLHTWLHMQYSLVAARQTRKYLRWSSKKIIQYFIRITVVFTILRSNYLKNKTYLNLKKRALRFVKFAHSYLYERIPQQLLTNVIAFAGRLIYYREWMEKCRQLQMRPTKRHSSLRWII